MPVSSDGVFVAVDHGRTFFAGQHPGSGYFAFFRHLPPTLVGFRIHPDYLIDLRQVHGISPANQLLGAPVGIIG
jgi:hypothetical protein